MSIKGPKYLKAKQAGSRHYQGWETQANAPLPKKPDDISALIADLNNSQFLEVNNQKNLFSELPKKGFRHIGFKHLRLRKHKTLENKNVLPSLNSSNLDKSNILNSSMEKTSDSSLSYKPKIDNKRSDCVVGYQFEAFSRSQKVAYKNFDKRQRSTNHQMDSSSEYKKSEESARLGKSVTKLLNKSIDMALMPFQNERIKTLNEDMLPGRIHARIPTSGSIDKTGKLKKVNPKYFAFMTKERENIKKVLKAMPSEINEMYIRSRPSRAKQASLEPLGNIKTLLKESEGYPLGGGIDLNESIGELKRDDSEKETFMRMIYKRIGKSIEGYQKDESYEQSYEENRVSFEKRMESKLKSFKKLHEQL